MADDLKKLYDAVSQKFDVGSEMDFRMKMATTTDRKKFYDTVSAKGFELGDYTAYETRLAPPTIEKKSPSGSDSTMPATQDGAPSGENGTYKWEPTGGTNPNDAPLQGVTTYSSSAPGTTELSIRETVGKANEDALAASKHYSKVSREKKELQDIVTGMPAADEIRTQFPGIGGLEQAAEYDDATDKYIPKDAIFINNDGNPQNKYTPAEIDAFDKKYRLAQKATVAEAGDSRENIQRKLQAAGMLEQAANKQLNDKYTVLKDLKRENLKEFGITDSFFEGMAQTDSNIKLAALAQQGDDIKLMDALETQYVTMGTNPEREDSGVNAIAGMAGGQVVPLTAVLGTGLVTGGIGGLAAGIASGGVNGYGSNLQQGYMQARSQGKSPEEALQIAKAYAPAGAAFGAAEGGLGAVNPFAKAGGAVANKALIQGVKTALVDAGMDGTVAMGMQIANNKYAQGLGLDVNTLDGVLEQGAGEVGFSLAVNMVFGGVKLAPKIKEQLVYGLSQTDIGPIQTAVDEAVKAGVLDAAKGSEVLNDIVTTQGAVKTMPVDMSDDSKMELLPKVKQKQALIAELETTDEAFRPGIEAKLEVLDREIREDIGAPLTLKEQRAYEKLQEHKGDKEKPLSESEKAEVQHYEKRIANKPKEDVENTEGSTGTDEPTGGAKAKGVDGETSADAQVQGDAATGPTEPTTEGVASSVRIGEVAKKINNGRKELLAREPESLREAVMQYFAGGGKVTPDDLLRYTGQKGADSQSLFWAKKGKAKGGMPADRIANEVFGNWKERGHDEQDIINEIFDVLTTYGKRSSIEADLRGLKEDADFTAEYGVNKKEYERLAEQAERNEEIAADLPELAEATEQAGEMMSEVELDDADYESINKYLAQFKDADGEIDWQAAQAAADDVFNAETLVLTNNALNKINTIFESYDTSGKTQRQEISANSSGQKTTERKAGQQAKLARAQAEYEQVVKEHDAVKAALAEDLQSKQGKMFGEGNNQKLFDDTQAMQQRADALGKQREQLKGEVDRLQKLVDENLPGQTDAFDEQGQTQKHYEEIAGSKPNPNTGRIPVQPILGKSPKNIADIIFDVTKETKQRLFFAKPRSRKSLGAYTPGNTAIKIRFNGDLDTTAHELGHSIDDHFGLLSDMQTTSNLPVEMELSKFSPFGSTPPKGHPNPRLYKLGEGFAEWLRAYIVNPDAAKQQAPNTFALYEATVNDAYKKAIDTFSEDVRTYAGASGRDMVLSNVQWKPKEKKNVMQEIFDRSDNGNMFSISWADKLAANFVNPFKAFNKANEYLMGLKGIDKLLPQDDPEVLARALLRIDSRVSEILENGMVDSKLNRLKDADGNVKNLNWLLAPLDNTDQATIDNEAKDVAAYMIAERTVELADKFDRESVLTGIGGGIFKDIDVAQKALDEFKNGDPDRLKRVEEAAGRYREMADDVLQYMVDKGRMSKEQYDEIKKNNLYYVGLQRVMETEPGKEVVVFKGGGGGKLGSKADVVKKIQGSTKQILNPYISLMETLYKGVKEADRNEVLLTFRNLMVNDRGMHEGDPKRYADIGAIVGSGDKETIPIFVDGKAEHWRFQEDVYKALKGLDESNTKIHPALTALPKLLRWTVTNFPVFALRNVVRDTQDRMLKSNENTWRNAYGLKDFAGKKSDVNDLALSGGLGAGHYMKDKSHYDALLGEAIQELSKKKGNILLDGDLLKRGWKGYENLLSKSETANRVAEYRAAYRNAKAKGLDDYNAKLYAGYQAADLIDFAVMGYQMKWINQLIPFSNAAVQGLRSTVVRAKENPKGFAIRMALLSIAPAIAEWLLAHDDEETAKQYEEMPGYQRDMFYNFKVAPNIWASIPKPYELSMPAAGVSRTLSYASGNEKALDGYAGSVAKTMIPADLSNVSGPLQALVEQLANKDLFREQYIVPPHEEALNLALRKTGRASRLGKALQDVAGIDARRVDHFVKGTGSYFGNTIIKASDIGRDDKKSFDLGDLGFFKQSPAYNSKSVQEYLENVKDLGLASTKDYKEFKRLMEDYFEAKDEADKEQTGKVLIEYAKSELAGMDKVREKKLGKKKAD